MNGEKLEIGNSILEPKYIFIFND